MTRVTKAPEERRAEILDAAEELFISRGYENTAISDIVKKLGVAQGTFYYYFKSKDEILCSIIERYVNQMVGNAASVLDKPGLSAQERLEETVKRLLRFPEIKRSIFFVMHDEKNELMRHRILHMSVARLMPIFKSLITQGIEQGFLELEYPDEFVFLIVSGIQEFVNSEPFMFADEDTFRRKQRVIESFITKCLGLKAGSLCFGPE